MLLLTHGVHLCAHNPPAGHQTTHTCNVPPATIAGPGWTSLDTKERCTHRDLTGQRHRESVSHQTQAGGCCVMRCRGFESETASQGHRDLRHVRMASEA